MANNKVNPFTGKLQKLVSVALRFKGSVDSTAELPLSENTEGDIYKVKGSSDSLFIWSISDSSGDLDDWKDIGNVSSIAWGELTGTLSDQTDLQNALDDKADDSDLNSKQDSLTFGNEGEVPFVNSDTDEFDYLSNFKFINNLYDISQASLNDSFDTSSKVSSNKLHDVAFNNDGSKMYITDADGEIHEYGLNPDYDITTASFLTTLSVSNVPRGLAFNNDGSKVYIATQQPSGDENSIIYEYDLSTEFDLSTASLNDSFVIDTLETNADINGIFFKSDGSHMFAVDSFHDSIWDFTLGTAWDITTINNSNSVDSANNTPSGLWLSNDGLKLFVSGSGTNKEVRYYKLDTAWDVTGSKTLQSTFTSSDDSIPTGVFLKPDGSKMFVSGNFNDTVYEYDIPGDELQTFDIKISGKIGDGSNEYTVAQAKDAVDKKHSQNSDTILDEGNANEVSSSELKILVDAKSGIQFLIDGSGSEISTGIAGWVEVPFDCTIEEVRLLADQSGSITVDIWKDTYANYPPTDADSITASAVPSISGATKSEDTTLTGWTTSLSKGDLIYFNVDSVTTIQKCLVSLICQKT